MEKVTVVLFFLFLQFYFDSSSGKSLESLNFADFLDNFESTSPKEKVDKPKENTDDHEDAHVHCREVVEEKYKDSGECFKADVTLVDARSFVSEIRLSGSCRWDYALSVCLCPRSFENCIQPELKSKCHWHKPSKKEEGGACISNAERFYNVLHNLLVKRGKKDFAVRIQYNSKPAQGELPYGPYGPSFINYGIPFYGHGNFDPYGKYSYGGHFLPQDYIYNSQGYGGNGYYNGPIYKQPQNGYGYDESQSYSSSGYASQFSDYGYGQGLSYGKENNGYDNIGYGGGYVKPPYVSSSYQGSYNEPIQPLYTGFYGKPNQPDYLNYQGSYNQPINIDPPYGLPDYGNPSPFHNLGNYQDSNYSRPPQHGNYPQPYESSQGNYKDPNYSPPTQKGNYQDPNYSTPPQSENYQDPNYSAPPQGNYQNIKYPGPSQQGNYQPSVPPREGNYPELQGGYGGSSNYIRNPK